MTAPDVGATCAPVAMSYPEQFTMEALAELAERIPGYKSVRDLQ